MAVVKCPSCGTAINVPDGKTGLWWGIGCLIAALAIPMVVAVIGLLAAIAIPSFAKARDTAQVNACVNNLRMLDAAKEAAAMERSQKIGDSVSDTDVSRYLKSGFAGLICPKGGAYTINPVGQDPECSVHGQLSGAVERRGRRPGNAEIPAAPRRRGTCGRIRQGIWSSVAVSVRAPWHSRWSTGSSGYPDGTRKRSSKPESCA